MAQLSPSRAALVSLVLFATMIAFAQPLSVVAADHLLLNEPVGATYAMWHQYVSSPKDVDFIGDSRVAIDTDTSQVAGELQMATGVQESVGALGVGGTDVVTERAVVYRVVHLQRRPRMVVLSFSEFQYSNPNNVDPTANLWQMTEPYDLGFMRFAYTVDPNRGRLLRGWGLPVIPNSLFTAVIMRQHLNTIGAMRWILGDTSAPPTTPAGDQAVPSGPRDVCAN